MSFRLDSLPPVGRVWLSSAPVGIGLIGKPNIECVELCEGFEELFESEFVLGENGWILSGAGEAHIGNGELSVVCEDEFTLRKGRPSASFEVAVNVRTASKSGLVGLRLGLGSHVALGYYIEIAERRLMIGADEYQTLPDEIVLGEFHQMRIIKAASTATCSFDDVLIGEFSVSPDALTAAIVFDRVEASVEMIRWTVI